MTKLLHISANTYPPLDGKHHHTKNIWKELSKGFDEYHILARSEDNKYVFSKEDNIYLHLVPKITKKSKTFFFTSFWMFYIIKKYKITHLLSQCPIVGGFSAVLASKVFKIPLMVEINGLDYIRWDEKNTLFGSLKYIQNYVFRNSTKIRYPNMYLKYFLEKNNFFNGVFIQHRVKHSIFNKQKQRFKLNDTIKIISVGRFVWEKDYKFLINTLQFLNLNIELTLIGGGPDKKQYLDSCNKENNNFKLKLINWIEQKDMIDLIISSDIYIQTSISETGPRTILEAMAMQMPIISSDVGLFPDISNLNIGLMYKKHNKEDLLNKINFMLENERLREQLAKNAYRVSINKYEWNKVFELYRNEILIMDYNND